MERAIGKLVMAPALAVLAVLTSAPAAAADAPKTRILTCRDANGRPVISDASDPRCFRPPPTPDEIAKQDEEHRKLVEDYNACKAAQRSDQSLLSRYPSRAAHDGARQKALDGLAAQMRGNQARIEQLLAERKRLLGEAEFHPDGKLPPKLRRDLDSNGALLEARRQAIANQEADAANINKFYDKELVQLEVLWKPRSGEGRACVQPRVENKEGRR